MLLQKISLHRPSDFPGRMSNRHSNDSPNHRVDILSPADSISLLQANSNPNKKYCQVYYMQNGFSHQFQRLSYKYQWHLLFFPNLKMPILNSQHKWNWRDQEPSLFYRSQLLFQNFSGNNKSSRHSYYFLHYPVPALMTSNRHPTLFPNYFQHDRTNRYSPSR